MIQPPPPPTLFPYTTLFRSVGELGARSPLQEILASAAAIVADDDGAVVADLTGSVARLFDDRSEEHTSELSHSQISYAVFCLKKKKNINHELRDRLIAALDV